MILYIVERVLYIVEQALYTVEQALYIVEQALYTVEQALYIVEGVLYIVEQALCIPTQSAAICHLLRRYLSLTAFNRQASKAAARYSVKLYGCRDVFSVMNPALYFAKKKADLNYSDQPFYINCQLITNSNSYSPL